MTAEQAIEMGDAMRPNNEFDVFLKQLWLREVDARLRRSTVDRSQTSGAFAAVGADMAWTEGGLEEETKLLVPDAYSGLYPHWLCAQMDLALGETDRAANELQLYSDAAQDFAVWLRKTFPPMGGVQFQY